MTEPFALTPAQQTLHDTALNNGFTAWCGVKMVELRPGFARLTLWPRTEMLTPWGTMNGSVINALVEISAFFALVTELRDGELPVTNDIFLQHVRPLPGDAEYTLTGQVLRKGRTMAWLEATAWVGGKACSFARLTKTLTKPGAS
jgi:uncharacterized protein (TIGR00369 family)